MQRGKLQRKLVAAAVAGALGAPALALAQASTVQVYGRVYMEYAYVDQGAAASGGSLNNVDAFQTPGSNIGFRGEEKLGGGLSAWFQCESTADLRGVGQEGFCGRNSAVGFKGGFGNIYMGRWDTPMKRALNPGLVGQLSGIVGYANVFGGGAGSQIGNAARAVFISRRQSNIISYDSPRFGGFGVMAAVTTGQVGGAGQGTASTTAAVNAKPRIYSLGANYRAGPLYIGAAYERHREFGAAATSGPGVGDLDDTGWGLSAAYTFGPVKVGGGFLRQKFETSVATESEIDAWRIGVDWRIAGPHQLLAAYTKADDVKGNSTVAVAPRPAAINGGVTGNTGADLWSVTYRYNFSKRTYVDLSYAKLDNDANAAYRLRNTFGAAVAGGNNEDAFAVAVSHRF